jgi:hypothetical protein
MKIRIKVTFATLLGILLACQLYSQNNEISQEIGITTGGFTNFPANQDYLKKYMSLVYIAPYYRIGRHEFSAGFTAPVSTDALFFNDRMVNPRLGAIAGYKFYVFNPYGRENLFIHYSFEYIRLKGTMDTYYNTIHQTYHWTETDTYINNVIGLGYNLFFDMNARFGLYYILDYMITQTSYKIGNQGFTSDSWTSKYVWNNLSTHIGFIFKLTSVDKKVKK